MRIKKFIAANINEAMQMVRHELGPDAIIISNDNFSGEIHLTAALEEKNDFYFDENEALKEPSRFDDSLLRECLDYHGVVAPVKDKILAEVRSVQRQSGRLNDRELLEAALNNLFVFADVLDLSQPLKMFMGTPGAGKSTAIAKTAAQARFRGISSAIVSTDNLRAGANKQLEAFAKILEQDFFFCKDPRTLYELTTEIRGKYQLILIDTPGINPFVAEELRRLSQLAEAVKSCQILTMDGGKNAFEAVEVAENFADIGVSCLLPTRLDLTRRIGAVLSAAACCRLQFCAAGVSASIAAGLAPVDAPSLARLVLA